MDFDDLDEALEERAAAGELDEVAGALLVAEAPEDYRGGYLWPLPRCPRLPGLDALPTRLRDSIGEFQKAPRIRLFVFYGAGDSFPFWAQWMAETPDWVEAAVYEWPRHGGREDEQLPGHVDGLVADAMEGLQAALKQHAKGGPLEGAPFALAGHSIGVRIMLGVAQRAKKTLGLEPAAVYVLDRAAPQHSLCSEFGKRLLDEDAEDFMRIFNPQVHQMYARAREKDPSKAPADLKERRMLEMWMGDIKFQTQTQPEGFHLFKCPLHVFVATQNWVMDSPEARKALPPEALALHKERCSILASEPQSEALWDFPMYEDWKHWTTEECVIHRMDTDHASLKRFPGFLRTLWSTLREHQAPAATV